MGQGKYDADKVYWDKLKTLVTEVGVPPSEQLLAAYLKTENKNKKGVNSGTDIGRTLQILKMWGENPNLYEEQL